jgi:hypothetical protein
MSEGLINERSLMSPVYQTQKLKDEEYYEMFPNAYKPSWMRECEVVEVEKDDNGDMADIAQDTAE